MNSLDKLIEYWTEEDKKADLELEAGNPNNKSFVELMRPKQMLYNLLQVKQLQINEE